MDSTEGEIDLNLTAVDIGYNFVKALSANGRQAYFPSVVGTPVHETFSLPTAKRAKMVIELPDSGSWPVGETALQQSAYVTGRRDAGWVLSQQWDLLLCFALSELHQANVETCVVTGLPLEDWGAWAEKLRKHLVADWRFRRDGGNWQTVTVKEAFVITQPYGSLLNMAMSGGKILTNAYSTGMVGIVDIGGNTLNLLVADCLQEIGQWTTGDGLGLLKALDATAKSIHSAYPGISPKTHEVAQWLANGKFPYGEDGLDIMPFARPHLEPLIEMILNRLSEAWPEPGRYSAVLLTGGGALALGPVLKERMKGVYPKVEIANDAQLSNCKGYLKLARDMWG